MMVRIAAALEFHDCLCFLGFCFIFYIDLEVGLYEGGKMDNSFLKCTQCYLNAGARRVKWCQATGTSIVAAYPAWYLPHAF